MVYWFPRIALGVCVVLIALLGILPATVEHVAGVLVTVLLGLALFSLTMFVFRAGRSGH